MPGEPRNKYVLLGYKSFIAFGLGIAVTLLYQFFCSPIHTTLLKEKSPSGKYVCVIDEYSPWLWTGPPVPYLAFRIYSSDDMQPLENESQSIWYEYESRGRGIDRGGLGIAWNGDTATIFDAIGPAAEWNPIDSGTQSLLRRFHHQSQLRRRQNKKKSVQTMNPLQTGLAASAASR